MTRLSADEVRHVAELVKLKLTAAEIELFASQLSAILDYAAQIQEVDTSQVPPTATVLPLRSIMRDDVTEPRLSVDEALANAPNQQDSFFKVHAILDGSQ